MYFNEADNSYLLPGPHDTDDIEKVIWSKVKVKVRQQCHGHRKVPVKSCLEGAVLTNYVHCIGCGINVVNPVTVVSS